MEDEKTILGFIIGGYEECALWSSHDEAAGKDTLSGMEESAQFKEECKLACEGFFAENKADCLAAIAEGLPAASIGHDLWLTRNGHGSGFWDRTRELSKGLRDRLSDAARKMGEQYAYVGEDGKAWID